MAGVVAGLVKAGALQSGVNPSAIVLLLVLSFRKVPRTRTSKRTGTIAEGLTSLDVFGNPDFAVIQNFRRVKKWPEAVGRPLRGLREHAPIFP
jgi:hypothetical protein